MINEETILEISERQITDIFSFLDLKEIELAFIFIILNTIGCF
jgi:hypothetical protein